MASTSSPTPSLVQRVQALPQELQDMIFGYATIPSTSNTDLLPQQYRPPSALQINRKTRGKFASEYYPATTIRVDFHRLEDNDNVRMLGRFMDSLLATHLDIVQAIEIDERIPIAKCSVSYAAWTANSSVELSVEMLQV